MLRDSAQADIAVGYFFISGFDAIADPLGNVDRIRILVGRTDRHVFEEVAAGIQQLDALREQSSHDRVVGRTDAADLASQAVGMVAEGVAALPQTDGAENAVVRLRDMIRSGQVNIRAYSRDPLHAKAYLCWYDDHAEPGAAVVGSSNFTLAGFHGNTELNVRVTGDAEMADLGAWFDALWADSEDIGQLLVEELNRSWPLARTTPYQVYLKALYELYGDEVGRDEQLPLTPQDQVQLANFQVDAVRRGLSMIETYGGCYIGDVVGLGKTFIGAELLRQLRQSYPGDGPPLILCPAGLIPMWEQTNEQFGLGALVISQSRIASPPESDYEDEIGRYVVSEDAMRGVVLADEYPHRGAVLVDEAHNFRNNNRRYAALRHYLDSTRHKVILLSATPQNLGPMDIYRQLRLFLDEENHGLDIEPLALLDYFRSAEAWISFNRQHQEYLANYEAWKLTQSRPSAPAPPKRPSTPRSTIEEVLSPIFIRRRRMDIGQLYADATIDGEPIRFPKPVLDNIEYRLDEVYRKAGSFKSIQSKLKQHKASRYMISEYLTEDAKSKPEYEDVLRARERTANLMKTLLFKRLESSIAAFRDTLDNLCTSNRNFATAIESGTVPVGRAATQILSNSAISPEDLLDALRSDDAEATTNPSLMLFPVTDFQVSRWLDDLKVDFELLSDIRRKIEGIGPEEDDKLQTLIRFLDRPEVRAGKVLIFSESEATINYLYKHLARGHEDNTVEKLTGSNSSSATSIIRRFAPEANLVGAGRLPGRPIRTLLATDVVSEGQNLQDCHRIINYDLHWNPVRLIQRFGRIDRIGSAHDEIYLHNTWPDLSVDSELSLTDKLGNRIQSFHDAIGLDSKLLSEAEQVNQNAMYRIYGERQLPTLDDGLDEIAINQQAVARLQRIRDDDPDLWAEISDLPDGIRSALEVPRTSIETQRGDAIGQEALLGAELMHGRSPFDSPTPGDTVVLVSSSNLKRCYAVGDDLQPRVISPAQFISSVECAPGTPSQTLPVKTNERVTAATDALRDELRRELGTMRRRSETRSQRFVTRKLQAASQHADELGLNRARIRQLQEIFSGDLPPDVEAELARVRELDPESIALVRRLEALRERNRLNPRPRRIQPAVRTPSVVKPLCSDGLV